MISGVIGVGVQGSRHARVYSELRDVDQLYVYDVNEISKRKAASEYNAFPASSVDEVLEMCDAVSICVPTQYHYEIAMKAIDMGTNFLVEKPVTDTYHEANELVKSVTSNIITGVGHIERFNPIIDEINNLISSPTFVEINRHNPGSSRINDTNVVKDLMIHDIDIVRNVFFPDYDVIQSISCGDDNFCVTCDDLQINNTSELPVVISASRNSSKKTRRIYIEDENYTIEGDYMNQDIYIYKKPDIYNIKDNKYTQENIIEKVAIGKVEPLRVELIKFLDCCLTGTDFPISLNDGARNIKACEEICEAIL